MRPANLCVMCKGGRNLCGNSPCPLLARFSVKPKVQYLKTDFFGPSPNIFVGRYGYPKVNVGPLGAIEDQKLIDAPQQWLGMDYQKLIELRSLLIRSKDPQEVMSRNRTVQEIQTIAMADRPADIEMAFKHKPFYRPSFSDIEQPMGPSASIKTMKLTENPHVPRFVEYLVSDDIRSSEASVMLYEKGEDVYKISSILSSGALGFERRKKLVPTRWSITAMDDIIAKNLMEQIRYYPELNDFLVFESEYLHNHFVILLMPGAWEYENFEAWSPGSTWAADIKEAEIVEEYEPFQGRKTYAEGQGGGYYAARIAATEALHSMRRQARIFSIREIYEGYQIPMGVWVVRETARNAFKQMPKRFSTLKQALDHMSSRLRTPVETYKKKSKLFRQMRLQDFL